MRTRNRLIRALPGVLLVLGPLCGSGATASDLNGDRHVDVLDVQSAVLTATFGGETLNVTDLLRVLALATDPDEAPPEEGTRHVAPSACFYAAHAGPETHLAEAAWAAPAGPAPAPTPAATTVPDAPAMPRAGQRYLYALTPHAPPAVA